jgi:hypothetical protein
MDIISYCHNLDDQILVKLQTRAESAVRVADIARWLQIIEGIVSIQPNNNTNELAIAFDKSKIDVNSLLNLLGYAGPVIRPKPSPVAHNLA